MPLSTIFQLPYISWRSVFIGGGNLRTRRKPDLLQVTDKLDHIIVYTSPWSRFKLTTSVVIGTHCLGSCKSKYHTITATTAPQFFSKCDNNQWIMATRSMTAKNDTNFLGVLFGYFLLIKNYYISTNLLKKNIFCTI
jgi:hypothetical protein